MHSKSIYEHLKEIEKKNNYYEKTNFIIHCPCGGRFV